MCHYILELTGFAQEDHPSFWLGLDTWHNILDFEPDFLLVLLIQEGWVEEASLSYVVQDLGTYQHTVEKWGILCGSTLQRTAGFLPVM